MHVPGSTPTPAPSPTPTPLAARPTSILTPPTRTIRSLTRGEIRAAKDLRARTSAAAAAALCARAEYLPRPDRDLILAVFNQGLTLTQLQSATGTPTRRLSRRLRAIVDRLSNPCFALVVTRAHTWESRLASVARCVFVEGRTLSNTSRQLKLSYAQTRAARDVVETLLSTITTDKGTKEAA